MWSVSDHGPTPRLLKELLPLLEQYKVALYFNGHDHSAQHIHLFATPATGRCLVAVYGSVFHTGGRSDGRIWRAVIVHWLS